jgi:glycosyltransferase involved in cell wall biosynthesis
MANLNPRTSRTDELLHVHGVIWNALTGLSLGYALTELLDNLPKDKADCYLWCLRGDLQDPRPFERVALPNLIFRMLCKAGVPFAAQGRLALALGSPKFNPGEIIYLWPPYDLRVIKRAQDRGCVVVAERTNCMGEMCRDVLSRAYARRGHRPPPELYGQDAIDSELQHVLACDYVTAPNEFVTQSLLNAGIPSARILETSYGFSAKRLARAMDVQRPKRAPVFAFVGLGIIRKGLDVLLEAWEQAGVGGTLLIAGLIADEIRAEYGYVLERTDVQELGYVADVATIYAAADVFVFPTHEEGGPLVIYEAAACGLASIVSPMGAGRIVRHETEALIVDPLDVHDVAAALTKLANDPVLRQSLGANATKRAREFTWAKVGNRFYEQLRAIGPANQL